MTVPLASVGVPMAENTLQGSAWRQAERGGESVQSRYCFKGRFIFAALDLLDVGSSLQSEEIQLVQIARIARSSAAERCVSELRTRPTILFPSYD